MPVVVYSPVEQGRPLAHPGLAAMAADRGVTSAPLALAWLLARDGVLGIPRAGSIAHVRDNQAALDLTLSEAEQRHLDARFTPPCGPQPLAML